MGQGHCSGLEQDVLPPDQPQPPLPTPHLQLDLHLLGPVIDLHRQHRGFQPTRSKLHIGEPSLPRLSGSVRITVSRSMRHVDVCSFTSPDEVVLH